MSEMTTQNIAIHNQLKSYTKLIEKMRPFNNSNFINLGHLTFLWVLGDQEAIPLCEKMQTEINNIVSNKQVVQIFHSKFPISFEEIMELFQKRIRYIQSQWAVPVQKIKICPIILPDFYNNEQEANAFLQSICDLKRWTSDQHIDVDWHPYLFILNEYASASKRNIRLTKQWMSGLHKATDSVNNCLPCCLLLNVDERGRYIRLDQRGKIIVMLALFQDARCTENTETIKTILKPITDLDDPFFFTARAVSICEPVKSLNLKRMLVVFDSFMNGTLIDSNQILERFPLTFFSSNYWVSHIKEIPHDEAGMILIDPVFGVMPSADQNHFKKNLDAFCDKYYLRHFPIDDPEADQNWWNDFWEKYFVQKLGSVKYLDQISSIGEKLYEQCLPVPCKMTIDPPVSDFRRQQAYDLKATIQGKNAEFISKVFSPTGIGLQRIQDKKNQVNHMITIVRDAVQASITSLNQTELLVNTGGVSVNNPYREAQQWFYSFVSSNKQTVYQSLLAFQRVLCRVFQNPKAFHTEAVAIELLDICNQLVSGSIKSKEQYMKQELNSLAADNLNELLKELKNSWLFPIRMYGARSDQKHTLYVLGNSQNMVTRRLLEHDEFAIGYRESTMDDRVEIVRISSRFHETQIYQDMER